MISCSLGPHKVFLQQVQSVVSVVELAWRKEAGFARRAPSILHMCVVFGLLRIAPARAGAALSPLPCAGLT